MDVGAYAPGSNPALDAALDRMPAIEAFLRQDMDDATAMPDTIELLGLVSGLTEISGGPR